ncbi:MAG: hypothetical protein SVU88_00155, partial [Candidatus Nanohaloarchaea archaeon]|nr:hypothetical protein [Candidatus Nanohaloarchaea archaeon]
MHGEETAADADGRGRDPAYDAATAREDAGIVEAMLAAAHPERDGPPYPRERGAVERAPTIADTDAVYDGPVDLTSLDDGRYTRLCRAAGFVPRRGQVPGDLLDGYHATGGDATTDDIRADAPVSPFAGGDGGLARNALTHTQALAKLGGDDRPAGSDAHAYDDLDIAIHDTAIDDMREVRIELAPDDLDHLVHRARQRTIPGLLRDATGMSRELLHHHRSSDDRSGIALSQFARLYRLAVAAAPRYDLERAAPADTDLVERTEHPGNGQELYRLDTAYQQWLFSAVDPEEDALEQHTRRIREYRRGGDRGIDPDVYDEVLDTVRARYDGVGEEHRVAFDDPVCARHPLSNLPQFDDYLFDD